MSARKTEKTAAKHPLPPKTDILGHIRRYFHDNDQNFWLLKKFRKEKQYNTFLFMSDRGSYSSIIQQITK